MEILQDLSVSAVVCSILKLITDQQLHAQYLRHHLIELLELRLIDLE